MIVVSVGTNETRFDRLLEWVSRIESDEELVVQHGPSEVRPPGARCVDYVTFDELVALVGRSRVFVTHAGVGSILVSLSVGKRPIVVPRQRRHGEAVDDHQMALAARLGSEELVTVAASQTELAAAVISPQRSARMGLEPTALVRELRSYLVNNCRPPC
jgi:UDP-N-acetylglucosamine transferase subunit ALG13